MELDLCYTNAHWKVTSEEEEFNNQMDWMTYSVDSQFLSLAIPAQVAMVWEMAMYWLNNEDFFLPRLALLWCLVSAKSAQQPRLTRSLWYGAILGDDQPAIWW